MLGQRPDSDEWEEVLVKNGKPWKQLTDEGLGEDVSRETYKFWRYPETT